MHHKCWLGHGAEWEGNVLTLQLKCCWDSWPYYALTFVWKSERNLQGKCRHVCRVHARKQLGEESFTLGGSGRQRALQLAVF